MKRLTGKDLQKLEKIKREGAKFVYKYIRKHFSSWYVRIFSIDSLLESKELPSYWYKGKGDCTESQALKRGYLSLDRILL